MLKAKFKNIKFFIAIYFYFPVNELNPTTFTIGYKQFDWDFLDVVFILFKMAWAFVLDFSITNKKNVDAIKTDSRPNDSIMVALLININFHCICYVMYILCFKIHSNKFLANSTSNLRSMVGMFQIKRLTMCDWTFFFILNFVSSVDYNRFIAQILSKFCRRILKIFETKCTSSGFTCK